MIGSKDFTVLFFLLSIVISFYGFSSSSVHGQIQGTFIVENAFPNLTFNQPDGLFYNPSNPSKFYVTEQTGVIKVFDNFQNVNSSTVFLNITDRVLYGGEQGLLGLAFHPNFVQNGYFYVNYVADSERRTVIARFSVNVDNPNTANVSSEQELLQFDQPFSNHKGGQLAFGPDGFLYVGVGDGGSGGDPLGNGQNRSTLLGKILRINIDEASGGKNYSIPRDNPFVGNTLGYCEEIYAYGLRNPWRFSFDVVTGNLWVGDVGQDRIEEIDLIEKGNNYGWNIMEGTLCYNPSTGCNETGLTLPIWSYTHDIGNAVIGGYVYRGSTLPSLNGAYVYGDYGSGRIWALRYDGIVVTSLLTETSVNISSFGLDQKNELYFTAYDGKIYKLTPAVIPEYPSLTGLAFLLIATGLAALFGKNAGKLKNSRSRQPKI